jgi:TonB-linked SusC/RagA family outer membrane protein
VELGNSRNKYWIPSYDLGVRGNARATLSEEYSESVGYSLENQLTLSKSFNNHNITVTGVHIVRGSDYNNIQGVGSGFDYENLNVLSQNDEADETVQGFTGSFRMLSYLARAIYDYKGKYLVTASIRRDGVSRFGPANRFGTFPSFSLAWKLNEDFLQNIEQINMLKVRFGWGKTGNSNIGDFKYDDFLTGTDNFAPVFGVDQSLVPGTYIFYSFANPIVKWEAANMTNFGFDLNAFNNRLQLSAEYYIKSQFHLLVQREVSMIFGRSGDGSNPWLNAADLQNRGFELTANWRKREGVFNYTVTGTLTTINNKVKDLPISQITQSNTITLEDHSIGSLYGYVAERIITEDDFNTAGKFKYAKPSAEPAPGDLKYKDLNQDGKINDLDRTILGKTIPDAIIGLNFEAGYRNWDFSLFFYSMLGYDVFNHQRASLSSINPQDLNHNKLADFAENYYRTDRPSTEYVRADLSNSNQNDRVCSWWIEDASFLRLKDMQLGYSLPVKVISKLGLGRARIYGSAVNLLTITNYTGRDPETAGTNFNPLDAGTDGGAYPTPRSFTLGIQVDF